MRAPGGDLPYLSDPNPDRESCGRVLSNPAFVVVAALDDRDGNGTGRADDPARFDGLNQAMASSNALCIAAPRPADGRPLRRRGCQRERRCAARLAGHADPMTNQALP